ncbi:hypothetical protein CY34DRAFT_38119, partial [Suillus luteus UH-Slu-Lm8-n1]
YHDHRIRRDRIEDQMVHWNLQIDRLVAAYLEYRSRDSGDGMPILGDIADGPLLDTTDCLSIDDIELVDIFKRTRSSFRSPVSHRYPNETLIYY